MGIPVGYRTLENAQTIPCQQHHQRFLSPLEALSMSKANIITSRQMKLQWEYMRTTKYGSLNWNETCVMMSIHKKVTIALFRLTALTLSSLIQCFGLILYMLSKHLFRTGAIFTWGPTSTDSIFMIMVVAYSWDGSQLLAAACVGPDNGSMTIPSHLLQGFAGFCGDTFVPS